jgi:hypothetical protein
MEETEKKVLIICRRNMTKINGKAIQDIDLLAEADFHISTAAFQKLGQRINHEVLTFMKTQRIACLVRGLWFKVPESSNFLFCKLYSDHNFIIYAEFKEKVQDPTPYLNHSGNANRNFSLPC